MGLISQQEAGPMLDRWLLACLSAAARWDRVAMGMLRAALVIVLVWIGALKFVGYEADSIVPFVANSPLMSFLYNRPAEYRTHMNKEGELNPEHRAWHQENGTYFRDYHLLLDDHGDQIIAMTDDVAERIRKIGGTTIRSIGQISRMQRILDNDAEYVTPADMLSELREDD